MPWELAAAAEEAQSVCFLSLQRAFTGPFRVETVQILPPHSSEGWPWSRIQLWNHLLLSCPCVRCGACGLGGEEVVQSWSEWLVRLERAESGVTLSTS